MSIVRQYIEEVWNGNNLSLVDDVIATDYVCHPGYFVDRELHGREELKQFVNVYRTSFPDIRITIDDMFADGAEVVVRMMWYGTQRGTFLNIAPTNRQVTFAWININRLVDGKIVETWPAVDMMWALQQLGAAPGLPTG
jgi:steroid delta-isomerase-like uncharacterized protein